MRFSTIVSVVTLVWEYLPGSLQDKILSDGCLEKEQMVVSAIASTPQPDLRPKSWTSYEKCLSRY